jgi:hypothetical protein
MEEVLEKRQLNIYCPEHFTTFQIEESPKIICAIREHTLSNNFPNEEFWEYCCDCRTFFPSELAVGGKAKNQCRQCERPTVSRFVCGECKLITFDSDEDTKGKQYQLDSETFAVAPACPGCRTEFADEKLHLHKCAAIDAVLSTPREDCPFCKKATVKPKSKPKTAAPAGGAKCPKCRAENEPDSFFCNNCGATLRENPQLEKPGTATAQTQLLGSICPNCGATNQRGSTFCVSCGQALKTADKPKAGGSLPPPIPTTVSSNASSNPTLVFNEPLISSVKPPTPAPGNNKGCLIAVGALLGSILLCAVIQGVMNKNRSTSSSTTSTPSSSYSPGPTSTPYSPSGTSLPNSFQKEYRGTINGVGITMSLTRNGSELKGTARTSSVDTLEGTIGSDGTFSLKGFQSGSKYTGNYTGRINSDGTITGSWRKLYGSKDYDFYLSED